MTPTTSDGSTPIAAEQNLNPVAALAERLVAARQIMDGTLATVIRMEHGQDAAALVAAQDAHGETVDGYFDLVEGLATTPATDVQTVLLKAAMLANAMQGKRQGDTYGALANSLLGDIRRHAPGLAC